MSVANSFSTISTSKSSTSTSRPLIKRVLLVANDQEDCQIFAQFFSERFSSIILDQLHNTTAVLRSLVKLPRPDLIFLDLLMPGADGIECLTKLKANRSTRNIPVVLYSSSPDNDLDKNLSIRIGAIAFINKTSNISSLTEKITNLIEQLNRA
jgi:CheY-like chemotaxis protein